MLNRFCRLDESTTLRTMCCYATAALSGCERSYHGRHNHIVQTVAAQAQAGGHPPSVTSRQALPRLAWLPACAPGQTSRHAPQLVTASRHRSSRAPVRRLVPRRTAVRIRSYSPSRPDEGITSVYLSRQAWFPPRSYVSIRFSPIALCKSYLIRFRRFYCRACGQAVFYAHRIEVAQGKTRRIILQGFSPVMQYNGHGHAGASAAARVNTHGASACPCSERAVRPFSHSLWEKNSRPGGTMYCIKTGAQVSIGSSACQLCASPCAAWLSASSQSEQRLSQLCAAWRARRVVAGKPLHGRWAHTPVKPQPVQGRLI